MEKFNTINNTQHVIKRTKDLEFGDVVYIDVLFKENTNEYYNGYNVEDVLGQKYKNKFGLSSKKRPVMVLTNNNNEIHYVPLTSQHIESKYHPDTKNHYKCKTDIKNNAINPKNYSSYVELDNISTHKFDEKQTIISTQPLNEEDQTNIKLLLNKRSLQYSPLYDTKRYCDENKQNRIIKSMKYKGFKKENTDDRITFTRRNLQITIENNNIITYHHDRTLDDVIELHNPLIKYMQKLNGQNNKNKLERS